MYSTGRFQLLERAEEHLAWANPVRNLAAVDDQERRADVGHVGDGALFVEQLACFWLPWMPPTPRHQWPRVGFARKGEIVDAALC